MEGVSWPRSPARRIQRRFRATEFGRRSRRWPNHANYPAGRKRKDCRYIGTPRKRSSCVRFPNELTAGGNRPVLRHSREVKLGRRTRTPIRITRARDLVIAGSFPLPGYLVVLFYAPKSHPSALPEPTLTAYPVRILADSLSRWRTGRLLRNAQRAKNAIYT
jgi:hypothetical protein